MAAREIGRVAGRPARPRPGPGHRSRGGFSPGAVVASRRAPGSGQPDPGVGRCHAVERARGRSAPPAPRSRRRRAVPDGRSMRARPPQRRGRRRRPAATAHPAGRGSRSHASRTVARSRPRRARTSTSGSISSTASQVVGAGASPSRPSSSQPPARRTCSGTQRPTAIGGSIPSSTMTRGGSNPPLAPAEDDLLQRLQPFPQAKGDVHRLVLRLCHGAHGLDRVQHALDRGRVEPDDLGFQPEVGHGLARLAIGDRSPTMGTARDDEVRVRASQGDVVQDETRRGIHIPGIRHRSGHDRQATRLERERAGVGHADELVAQSQGEHDLGGGGEQGDDAHVTSLRARGSGRGAPGSGLSPGRG